MSQPRLIETRKPCVFPACTFLRAKNSYLCKAHEKIAGARVGTSAPRAHKFGAIRTEADNIKFDSKAEADHYEDLKLLLKAGQITNLRMHTLWPLHVNGVKIGHYESDFDYIDMEGGIGALKVIDVKGVRTAFYRWKRKHFEAEYGIHITEVANGNRESKSSSGSRRNGRARSKTQG